MASPRLLRVFGAVVGVGMIASALALDVRSTSRELDAYRDAARPAPAATVALPSAMFRGERGLPLQAIDEPTPEATATAARYDWVLLAAEASLATTEAPLLLDDEARAFELARLDTALALSAHALATSGRAAEASRRFRATLVLGQSIRARGTEIDLALGSAVVARGLRGLAHDRELLDELELRPLAAFTAPAVSALLAAMNVHHARTMATWLDAPGDEAWIPTPIRAELALGAIHDFEADLTVAEAAWARGDASCHGGAEAVMLCARFEKLREEDAAWSTFVRSLR